MKIIYLSNFFNHHQKPLADALYSKLGDNYGFIETWGGIPEEQRKLGYHPYDVPYVKRYAEEKSLIDRMISEADVVIFGEAPLSLIKTRIREGKLTIRDDESRYKNPNRYLKWPVYTYNSLYLNKGYLLCASAYAPMDYMLSGMNPRKCFRWGYFPEVKKLDMDALMQEKGAARRRGISILWVGRLIGLKHPEAAIYVAERLKKDGVQFELNIIGTGKLKNKLGKLIESKDLGDTVRLLGSMPLEEVREYMEKADIFLFTSDRCEGWGAVLNESMASGCAVIADSNIGAVPFLIHDGVNGLVYKSTNYEHLYEKVLSLVNNPTMIRSLGRKAYLSMVESWNAENAANNLILLCDALLRGEDTPVKDGPCSHAPLLMRTYKGLFKTL